MWLKNLPLKLTALGLAVLLWFHVATNRTYDYAREVALHAGPLPPGFALAAPLPKTIHLLFTGTGKELLRFMWEDASAQFLLEPRMSGAIPVSVDRLITHADANVHITQVVDPSLIDVFVDTVVSRNAAVRFQGEYGTAPDVALSSAPTVEPAQVTLRGPRSVVKELGTVRTQLVDVGTVAADLSRRVGLDLSGAYNVTAEPDSVEVKIQVAPRTEREIEGVAVDVADGWRTEPASVALQLSGAEGVLSALTPADCHATVTVPPVQGESLAVVEATVPALVELEAVQPGSVMVARR